ncbi:MAG: hypothetical protein ACRCS3_01865 [Paracoccaceae bacterium]
MEQLQARGIAVDFQARGGVIAALRVQDGDHLIAPLHRAPWTADEVPQTAPPHQRWLAGDFFCAPFGDGTADAAPLHGWTANGDWDGAHGQYHLTRPVLGATVTKHLTLQDDHPFIYQRHVFTGGSGSLPVANHAMVSLPQGGRISTSALRWCETPALAPETIPARGRSVLAYPARAAMQAFPTADGGQVDLGQYPLSEAHEDFVIALAQPGITFGWTAVARAEGYLFLSLRRADLLPLTMFWHSNGGRHYAPWSSRHTGVLGVEEGVGLALLGLSAGQTPDPLTSAGQPTALDLGATQDVRHVIGAIHWPTGEPVASITPAMGALLITGTAGLRRSVPFDDGFLG